MSWQKKVIVANHETNKVFDYAKNGTTLRFTLRVDIKRELNDFKEMLERALVDVKQEIERKIE